MKIHTDWSEATTNVNKAMMALLSCLETGKNAWIELRKNGDQAYPVRRRNPALDDPFNWTMAYGVPKMNDGDHVYFNDTERDLTENWIATFGTEEAVVAYRKDRTISKDLFRGIGLEYPVRIADANRYRREIKGDGYEYGYWRVCWKPKVGIPYWVADGSVGDVFTVCYTDEPVDRKTAVRRAAEFLADYAERLVEE